MPTEPVPAAPPKNFTRSCLLLLLREHPGHGYDLLQRLGSFGVGADDPGGLYRALRSLEQEGLVRSTWEASSTGPDRRRYELTRAGTEELHRAALTVAATRDTLDAFLSRYGEFVALSEPAAARTRTR